jgi:hypothetical protein
MPCDICSDTHITTLITSERMRHAVETGFNPFDSGLMPPSLLPLTNTGSAAAWKHHVLDGLLARCDWHLCQTCGKKIQDSGF